MSKLWKPRFVFAMGPTLRAQTKLAHHVYNEAPAVLKEMAEIIEPMKKYTSGVNLAARYARLADKFSEVPPSSNEFIDVVKEALADAGKTRLEPNAMSLLNSNILQNDKAMAHEYLEAFLDRRIALRFLLTHYIQLLNGNGKLGDNVDIFERRLPLSLLAQDAAMEVQSTCMSFYGVTPPILVEEMGLMEAEVTTARQPIKYIINELIKNSAQASIQCSASTDIPRIEVRIEATPKRATLTVVDSAGGIPPEVKPFDMISTQEKMSDIGGFGVGLPISRMYARFFEGDLVLQPNQLGTSATLSLPETLADDMDDPFSPVGIRSIYYGGHFQGIKVVQ